MTSSTSANDSLADIPQLASIRHVNENRRRRLRQRRPVLHRHTSGCRLPARSPGRSRRPGRRRRSPGAFMDGSPRRPRRPRARSGATALRALPQLRLGPVPVLLVGPAFSALKEEMWASAFGDHLLRDLRGRGLLRRRLGGGRLLRPHRFLLRGRGFLRRRLGGGRASSSPPLPSPGPRLSSVVALGVVGFFVPTASFSGAAAFFVVALGVVGFFVPTASFSGAAAFFDVALGVVGFFVPTASFSGAAGFLRRRLGGGRLLRPHGGFASVFSLPSLPYRCSSSCAIELEAVDTRPYPVVTPAPAVRARRSRRLRVAPQSPIRGRSDARRTDRVAALRAFEEQRAIVAERGGHALEHLVQRPPSRSSPRSSARGRRMCSRLAEAARRPTRPPQGVGRGGQAPGGSRAASGSRRPVDPSIVWTAQPVDRALSS